MAHTSLEFDRLIANAKEADSFAKAEAEPGAKENWVKIAASWRFLAERALAERSGEETFLR